MRLTDERLDQMEATARSINNHLLSGGSASRQQVYLLCANVEVLAKGIRQIVKDANTVLDHIPIEEFTGYFDGPEVDEPEEHEEDRRGF